MKGEYERKRRNTKKIEDLDEYEKAYGSELEGVINNEPQKNEYLTINYHKMNQFPYYLIGKIITKFCSSKTSTNIFLNGVGILIGPKIVLTVAHNLVFQEDNDILYPKRITFSPCLNGDFTPFSIIHSNKYFANNDYIEAVKKSNKEKQLSNDWGLVFLKEDVGDAVFKLFDIKDPEVKVKGNFYSFFLRKQKINKPINKISIVGYTEYKSNYRNNNSYKFLNCFSGGSTSIDKSICDEINFNNVSSQIISFEANQGKITSEVIEEEKEYFKLNGINSRIPLPNEPGDRLNNISETESVISTTHPQIENGIEYIILNDKEHNKDFSFLDVDKSIMSETIGEMTYYNDDSSSITYKLSTYKGQSGSPIFLREGDEYLFIGLHSRRGPSRGEILCEQSSLGSLNRTVSTDIELHVKQERRSLISFISNNSVTKINGICDYNLGLAILEEKKNKLIKVTKEKIEEISEKKGKNPPEKIESNFYMVEMRTETGQEITGLFKKESSLRILFMLAGEFFMIQPDFILLYSSDENILNYGYDCEKLLIDQVDEESLTSKIEFKADINMKKFRDFAGKKILDNFLETLGDDRHNKAIIKKNIKKVFNMVFEEICMFEGFPSIYGKLFKKIRKYILNNLDLNK